MKFPEDAPVTEAKRTQLRTRLTTLGVTLQDVEEQAARGGGPGGQKRNKTHSGVLLRYRLGEELIIVRWNRERQHALNRFLALRELADEVELRVSPETSARLKERARVRKQKDRARRRNL